MLVGRYQFVFPAFLCTSARCPPCFLCPTLDEVAGVLLAVVLNLESFFKSSLDVSKLENFLKRILKVYNVVY